MIARLRPAALLALLAVALVALAWMRGIDHDESQYVAAARLTADGLLPYRDYAYLQTPLHPFAFAPLAWLAGDWAWPALRFANALLGAAAVAACWRAMRVAGADVRAATGCAALFAACDILLFAAGTARNDALPAALLALSLAPILAAEAGSGSRRGALLIGLMLGAAAAAKISYAVPAAAYGLYAIAVRRHRPGWVALGALAPVLLVAATWAANPEGFVFGVFAFPASAPAEYYAATGRLWKLSFSAKAIDTLKFLALGPALIAIATVAVRRRGRPGPLEWLAVAGLVAALLPSPTWRQYLLPALPPVFVLLATHVPDARRWRIAAAVFAAAGLAPTTVAVARGEAMATAMGETRALAAFAGLSGAATLSPQLLPGAARFDPRFATGPFYFRSTGLLDRSTERRLHLVSRARIDDAFAASPPRAIVVGGEGPWSSGDAALDRALEDWAIARGWRRVPTAAVRLRVYAPPRQAAARAGPSTSVR